MHVRRDDTVLVITGRERGKTGKISRVMPKEERVVVAGVNLVKRHMKARPNTVQTGIIEKEAPLHASNVMLVCPKCNKPTRTGHRFYGEGEQRQKARFCKKCGEMLT